MYTTVQQYVSQYRNINPSTKIKVAVRNQLGEEALWYCFYRILQEDLDLVREHWNTHRIRDSKHDTVPGRPDELFFFTRM